MVYEMMKHDRRLFAILLTTTSLLWLVSGYVTAQAETPIDFQQDIRPILTEHCLHCHGPDEGMRQGDLRLDLRDAVTVERESGERIVVPGKPDSSQLLLRIKSHDPDLIMPPPGEKNPLVAEQISLLERWIQQGAVYTSHWAFVAPQQTDLFKKSEATTNEPEPELNTTMTNPIDVIVANRLGALGVASSPSASPAVICRRIYLDVIGLPPAPVEVAKFISLAEEDLVGAVEELVNRLLGSEHYGEKWARHWLDVARYADSNGYEKDLEREQWAWRDWVIRRINSDLPYDQFIIEQIAGDLLPGRTQDQLVATGFLRNGMVNEEGAIIVEQFRMEGLFDRMDCIGKAVLGMSIQCAQCHDHKYDPISQKEYYGMFAFLNNTSESQAWVYAPQQQIQIAEIKAAIQQLSGQYRTSHPGYQQELTHWEQSQRRNTAHWKILNTIEQEWVEGVNHPDEKVDHSVVVLGHPTVAGKMYVVAEPRLDGVTGLRLEALTHGDLPFGGPGRSYRGTFAISELSVEVKQHDSESWTKLVLKNATTDFAEQDQPLVLVDLKNDEKRRIGPIEFLIDDNVETGWRADRGPILRHTESVAVVQFAEPLDFPQGTQLKVSLVFKHSAGSHGRQSTMLGRMRFALTKSSDPKAPNCGHAATLAMQKSPDHRSPAEQAAVFAAWRKSIPALSAMNEQIAAYEQEYPEAHTSVLTITAGDAVDERHTFLLERGIWDKPQEKITAHVPVLFHPLKRGESQPTKEGVSDTDGSYPDSTASRLSFARWLVDPDSPLSARVQVNRVWQAIFGTGLVETPEDFGIRAPQPEYLDLLDWLAVDFVAHGWSTKHLIGTILHSATYQQSSRVSAENFHRDPQNRLLARGPRFRAEAEVVRDIALSVSGLLNPKIGGPSILPPVPESVLSDTFTRPNWDVTTGPERYRRALYVFRKRSMPDPGLMNFDTPNADFACVRRMRSNTPLAALVALNEPIFVEAARAMALRILCEGGGTDQERTDYAFRLCTSRGVKPDEQTVVLALLHDCRNRLAEGWLSINEVASGDSDRQLELPSKCTPQDAAAWVIVSRVLLNLDETLSKN